MNEPVAWMHTNSKQLFATTIPSKRDLHLFTPLYTHPMRELSDEEIRKVADEVFKDYKNWHYYQIDFARAIMKRCGIISGTDK